MPIEVEDHTVPHFKAPVIGKVELHGPEHADFFMSIVNSGCLVHKIGFVKTEVPTTVPTFTNQNASLQENRG